MSFGEKKSVFGPVAKRKDASGPHRAILGLLKEMFPRFTILEEEQIQCHVRGRQTSLPVDLVVKDLKLAIEVQGQQHFKYIQYFHQSPDGYKNQLERDTAKAQAIRDSGWSYLAINSTIIPKLTTKNFMKLITKTIKES